MLANYVEPLQLPITAKTTGEVPGDVPDGIGALERDEDCATGQRLLRVMLASQVFAKSRIGTGIT